MSGVWGAGGTLVCISLVFDLEDPVLRDKVANKTKIFELLPIFRFYLSLTTHNDVYDHFTKFDDLNASDETLY